MDGGNGGGGNNGKHTNFNVEDLLQSLMGTPNNGISTDPESFTDVNQIAGEYSALDNTINQLNSFLDTWDARHDQLRSEIKEALEEAAAENAAESSSSGDIEEQSHSKEEEEAIFSQASDKTCEADDQESSKAKPEDTSCSS